MHIENAMNHGRIFMLGIDSPLPASAARASRKAMPKTAMTGR